MILLPLILLATVTSLKIPINTNRYPSPGGLLILVNQRVKYLELSFTGKSYIYADLNSSQLNDKISKQLTTLNPTNTIKDTGISCPSAYCKAQQSESIEQGQSLKSKLTFTIQQNLLEDFPINVIYEGKKEQGIDGRINIFFLLEILKNKNIIQDSNFTILLPPQHEQIIFSEDPMLTQLIKAQLKKSNPNTVLINGFQIGKQISNITQLTLSLDVDGIAFPRAMANQMIQTLNKSNADCQWNEEHNLICAYSSVYPEYQLNFQNNSLLISQQSLIKGCHISTAKKQIVCQFFISICEENILMGGVKFLQRYPVTFTNNTATFNDPDVFPEEKGMVDLILIAFGLTRRGFCLLVIFSGILVLLKGYHVHFKCRPAEAYSKYGHLVSTSTSSIQSENSERDIHDIDTVKEVENFDIA